MGITNKNDRTDLNSIILILASKYNIDRVFLNTYYAVDVPFYELVILLSNKEHKSVGELDPQIRMSLKDFPKFQHVTLVAFQVKSKLIDGNLYLHMTCHPHKLIYQNPSSKFDLYPEGHSQESTLKSVNELFDRENHKVNEFKEGYYYFKERDSLSHAGFMLHQVFELRYRCMEIMVMGKERATHSIRSHHRYLVRMAPSLATIFKEGKSEDEIMLQFLEGVYRATRYEDNFDVDLNILLKLEERMENFMQITDTMFEDSVTNFKNYSFEVDNPKEKLEDSVESQEKSLRSISNDDTMMPEYDIYKSTADKKLELIITRLKNTIDIQGIYLFGQRTRSFVINGINKPSNTDIYDYYFDLLIVSESDIRETIGNIQASINKELEVSVLLLSFTRDQIQKQLDKNNPFFHRSLQYVDPLHGTEINLLKWEFHEHNGERTQDEMKEAKTKWHLRENNASGFYNGGKAIDQSEEVEIKVLLYNQAIEQACLGLLEYFYDYTPYQYNLKHLFSLCASLWQFPNDIFPRNIEEEKSLFDEFAQTVKDTRYQGWSMVGWDEAYRYDERCERFLKECIKLVRSLLFLAFFLFFNIISL
ncbi:hypothetical protein [Sphingobacterium multivorum]|uniref:hypothetical protein n=1 Tax=Sphingobacterium multivorum TaxID=28454 RepID=UPI0028A6FCF2|nr:hypothetical protein [Sphingobacterium multivorum]